MHARTASGPGKKSSPEELQGTKELWSAVVRSRSLGDNGTLEFVAPPDL